MGSRYHRILTCVLGLVVVAVGAAAQQPDPRIGNVERQYIEQELLSYIREKARIVAGSVVDRENNTLLVKKLCDLIADDKRPDECKK